MTQEKFPRPTSDLQPDLLRLSPRQAEVLAALQSFESGARASDIADELDMHVNTVRSHLEELQAKSVVSMSPGYSGGRGRPSMIFQARVPNIYMIASEIVTLLETLVALLPDTPEGHEQAIDLGRHWARRLSGFQPNVKDSPAGSSTTKDVDALVQVLQEYGFDPKVKEKRKNYNNNAGVVELQACPFVVQPGEKPPDLLCSMHDGCLQEAAGFYFGEDKKISLKLTPTNNQQPCVVSIDADTH